MSRFWPGGCRAKDGMPEGAKPPHDTGVPVDGLTRSLEKIELQIACSEEVGRRIREAGPCQVCGGLLQPGSLLIKETRCPDCCRLDRSIARRKPRRLIGSGKAGSAFVLNEGHGFLQGELYSVALLPSFSRGGGPYLQQV